MEMQREGHEVVFQDGTIEFISIEELSTRVPELLDLQKVSS